jgi:GAF domain-containing protein
MFEIQAIARSLQTLFQQVTSESFARTFPRLVLDRTGATRAAFRVKNSKNWQTEGLSWQNQQDEAINTIIPPSLHEYLLAGEAIALADERGGGSIACFPLRLEERAIGHLYLEHPLPPDDFTRTHGDTLHLLLASGASALENARRYERLEQAFPSENETTFRRLSENVPGVVYRYVQYADGRDAFLYVSSRVRDICEIDPETALANATAMWKMVHPEDVPKLQQAIADSLSHLDRPFLHDHRLITPSGREKWVRVIGTPERQTAISFGMG